MRPATINLSGAGNSSPVVLDYRNTAFQVTVGVTVVSGSPNYKLQYTFDDPFAAAGLVNWIDHQIMTGQTANFDTVINAGPVSAVRLNNAGSGVLLGRVYQAGP